MGGKANTETDRRVRPWFKVYDDELKQLARLKGARQILAVLGLLKHADEASREAYPTCETIGRRVSIAANHISAALKEAEQAGVIEAVGKVKRTIRYRVCPGIWSQEASRGEDQSRAQDQSPEQEDVPPAHGSKLLPQTGDRTDQEQNSEQIPPNPPSGGPSLKDAEAPGLFPIAPAEDRPEFGETTAAKKPKLSPELTRYADAIVTWASGEVRSKKTLAQVGKMRELMKTWVGTEVESQLHDRRFWTEVLRASRTWWNPARSGIATAMVKEAETQLQASLAERKAEQGRAEERQRLDAEEARMRRRADLEARAQAGDADAAAELWGNTGASCAG